MESVQRVLTKRKLPRIEKSLKSWWMLKIIIIIVMMTLMIRITMMLVMMIMPLMMMTNDDLIFELGNRRGIGLLVNW